MKKILILMVCFLLCACRTTPVSKNVLVDTDAGSSSKIKLSMVGDAMVHTSIYKDALDDGKYDFSKMFTEFVPLVSDADLMYYNQETIIGGDNLGFFGYPEFNTPMGFGKTMISLGFNLVSRANEHTMDQGEKGVLGACNFWNKYINVLTNGSACTTDEGNNPRILEMNGIKYALLSYTTVGMGTENEFYLNIYSDERALDDIKKVRGEVDLLLVAMHWGDEYAAEPNEEQRRIAKYLAGLGVDIVAGTHPHVVEPIEWIEDTLVIYSLGNFISGKNKDDDYNKRIGLLVNVDVIKTKYKDEIKITLENLNTELLYIDSHSGKDYKIIPFSKLDESILQGYKSKEIKYESIVKRYDQHIKTRTSS